VPLALILSSFVAASRIRGAAQQYVLAAHRIDPVLAPTVMFGRTPARGGRGEVTSPDVFRRMLGDIEADALFGMVDLIITGHFSDPEQVEIAAGVIDVAEARRAARALGRPALVTSVPAGDDEIGLLLVDGEDAVLFAHRREASAPSGTGDLVTASFGAGLIEGLEPVRAAERAARAAAEAVAAAKAWRASELPIVALADRIVKPTAEVRIERL